MTITDKIRNAIADRQTRLDRDTHLAAINARITANKAAHKCTKALYAEAREYTHKALSRG